MILLLTILHKDKGFKSFSFSAPTLETGLDIINSLRKPSEQLLSVQLVEGESVTKLPTDVFDGRAFAGPMHELALEWRTLLSGPATKPPKPKPPRSARQLKRAAATQERIDLLLKQAELMEARLAILTTTLTRLEAQYQRTSSTSRNHQFISRLFESQIALFEQHKRRVDDWYSEVVSQLNKLIGM